jgi:hypothetical protein
MERRTQKRLKKNFTLSENVVGLIKALADKHGLSEAAVISTAVVQFADREGVSYTRAAGSAEDGGKQ